MHSDVMLYCRCIVHGSFDSRFFQSDNIEQYYYGCWWLVLSNVLKFVFLFIFIFPADTPFIEDGTMDYAITVYLPGMHKRRIFHFYRYG